MAKTSAGRGKGVRSAIAKFLHQATGTTGSGTTIVLATGGTLTDPIITTATANALPNNDVTTSIVMGVL